MILGGGPNRIGQGIEFDYCCCHAAFALKEAGYETIMINCNPETVSTDYDTSDRLYFEPLTAEDVLEIIETERSNGHLHGVIVQFGGQTPLKLAHALEQAEVPILGTSPDMIDLAEDRDRFKKLLDKLALRQPKSGIATSPEQARAIAQAVGYPIVIRPSYVLGGRAMEIVLELAQLDRYIARLANDLDRTVGARQVIAEASLADRPLPLRRHRGRRRLSRRRKRHHRRRNHGAHRGSRHPFRRQRLRIAAALARPGSDRRARTPDPRTRARAPCRRPHERAICHQGWPHLCSGGQSAGVAHGAVRRQGHRHPGCQDRRPDHGRRDRLQASSSSRPPSTMSGSRRRCSRSPASPASIPCSGRR